MDGLERLVCLYQDYAPDSRKRSVARHPIGRNEGAITWGAAGGKVGIISWTIRRRLPRRAHVIGG